MSFSNTNIKILYYYVKVKFGDIPFKIHSRVVIFMLTSQGKL